MVHVNVESTRVDLHLPCCFTTVNDQALALSCKTKKKKRKLGIYKVLTMLNVAPGFSAASVELHPPLLPFVIAHFVFIAAVFLFKTR